MPTPTSLARRRLVRLSLAAPAALALGRAGIRPAVAASPILLSAAEPVVAVSPYVPAVTAEARSLELRHVHTGEYLEVVYYANGRYLEQGLAAISHQMRDWRENVVWPLDPALLDRLWALRQDLGDDEPVEVVCGYRTPATNAWLARRTEGVAPNSLHMSGMALDFRLPGRALRAVQEAAIRCGSGGVGYYPGNAFLHIDTGPPRAWTG